MITSNNENNTKLKLVIKTAVPKEFSYNDS